MALFYVEHIIAICISITNMKNLFQHLPHRLIVLTIWAVVYYLSGVLSLRFDDPQLHISVVWFPAGVATAAFLNSRWRLWPALCVLFVVLDVILDKPSFSRLPTETFYAILDLPSSLIIAWIVKRFSRPGDDLNIIMLWFASTIIISFLDAVLFGIGLSLAGKNSFSDLFWTGFIADMTGIFLATTIIMGFANSRLTTAVQISIKTLLPGLTLLAALVALSLWIFSGGVKEFSIANTITHDESLIFAFSCLPIILAAFLTLFWGNRGGSIALLTLSGCVIYYADKGVGPFFLKGLYTGEPLLLVQCYLSASALLLVFLRVVTRNIYRFNSETDARLNLQAIYQLNLTEGTLCWENLSGELAALPREILEKKEAILAQLHPEDKQRLAGHWQAIPRQQTLPAIQFRLQYGNGQWLHVTDSGALMFERQGSLFILGNWSVST